MKKVTGKYNHALVFTDNIDELTINQIQLLVDQEFTKDSKIRIMPDCHAGAGCVIGTTMTLMGKVVPNLVGVDIGCGMLTVELGNIPIDLEQLDKFIFSNIPSGMNVYEQQQKLDVDITKLYCWKSLTKHEYFYQSMGTLGGGNHFIEVDADENNNKYLIIHSGSRNLGLKIAQHYQDLAISYHRNKLFNKGLEIQKAIAKLKKENREHEIQATIEKITSTDVSLPFPRDLCYLENKDFSDYIHDMDIAQKYASENRLCIAKKIIKHLNQNFNQFTHFETVHNYIDTSDMILRKGAISAKKDEKVLIPINMRDGCIIGYGKGNSDFNYSGPHGAGRILSRSKAFAEIKLEDYVESMKGIYTNSVSTKTIDESCFAYKPIDEILSNIADTVSVYKIIKPLYNFKASE